MKTEMRPEWGFSTRVRYFLFGESLTLGGCIREARESAWKRAIETKGGNK